MGASEPSTPVQATLAEGKAVVDRMSNTDKYELAKYAINTNTGLTSAAKQALLYLLLNTTPVNT